MYLTQSLHRLVQQCPDMPLTIFGDRRRTVAQSADRIARLAGALRGLGIQPEDRVAFLGLNSDRYHEYLYAVPWAQAAVNPVNVRWSPAEIAFSLKDSQTELLLVDDAFLSAVPGVTAALLLARPPHGAHGVPVRFTFGVALDATLVVSLVAIGFAVFFGGRLDDIRLRRGTSQGRLVH